MTLSPQFLDELRARTSLTALISKTVKLTKAGREHRGCCPFHNEKTPSFYVNDDKGFYHCFGCSAHGDAIRWMTDQRGLPFIDAVKELAQAAGMDMPALDPRAAKQAERAKGLHEACGDAAAWFAEQLGGIAGGEARALLERRGIAAETARAFGMGFAPDSRGKLKAALKDYGDPMLVEAGLLIQVDGKEPYDRFRGRLMIPIRDPRGRTIAFGGRVLDGGEPKYLNSPDTPLFDKGRTLYNLDRAAPAVRKSGRVLVVEGYMDVIALAQGGFPEAVAPLGTALTEAQLERLWRMADVPILCLDGDSAGQKAALRAAHRALPMLAPGRSLAFATLPAGQDPDDLIREGGAEAVEKVIASPTSLADFLWRAELAAMSADGPDQRASLRDRLETIATTIQHADIRYEYSRFFKDKFYQVFGWKNKNNVTAIREAMSGALRHPGRGLQYALHRAVLLGLMRHPSVIMAIHQDIMDLPLKDRYLLRWKDHLIDAALAERDLTESLIEQILAGKDVSPIERRDLQIDLAFSFYSSQSEASTAVRDLIKVIEILVDESRAQEALRAAHADFLAKMTEEAFKEQNARREEASRAERALYEWLELGAEAA